MKQHLIYISLSFICITHSVSFAQTKNNPFKSATMEDKYIKDYLNAMHTLGKIKNVDRMFEVMTQASKNGITLSADEVNTDDIKYLYYEADVIYFRYSSNENGFFYLLTNGAWDLIFKVTGKK